MDRNLILDGNSIKIKPFDLTGSGFANKVDLLYYNNINSKGEILTSLVYNSGLRSADTVDSIIYYPDRLFQNSDIEKAYTISGNSNRWCNADLLNTDYYAYIDKSIYANNLEESYDITTDFAVIKEVNKYMYDGWYTLVSLSLQEYADSDSVLAGTLRYNSMSGNVEYNKSAGVWELIENIDSSIPIYNLIRDEATNEFSSYDFFVNIKLLSLNNYYLRKVVDNEWFSGLNYISPKIKSIEKAIADGKFDLAQLFLSSLSNQLLFMLT
jgi:hypothetical protein